jgi:hypothetical protein
MTTRLARCGGPQRQPRITYREVAPAGITRSGKHLSRPSLGPTGCLDLGCRHRCLDGWPLTAHGCRIGCRLRLTKLFQPSSLFALGAASGKIFGHCLCAFPQLNFLLLEARFGPGLGLLGICRQFSPPRFEGPRIIILDGRQQRNLPPLAKKIALLRLSRDYFAPAARLDRTMRPLLPCAIIYRDTSHMRNFVTVLRPRIAGGS